MADTNSSDTYSSDTRTRTVIVALPEGTRADWMRVTQILAWLKLPACVPVNAFTVRRRGLRGWFTRWTSRHLLDPIRSPIRQGGGITNAAGGRISRIDLHAMGTTARDQATARWRTWHANVARTTPQALTWPEFLAKETRDPKKKVSHTDIRARWEAQPRVLAMLAYNSYPAAPYRWDLDELAALQAGEAVYVALHWQKAITGDAVVTPDGKLLEPASDSVADRLRYLADATHVIHSLAPRQHLVAVKAAPTP